MEEILLVGQQIDPQTTLRTRLSEAGYEIAEVENGEKALEQIKNDLPEIVLLNERLPDMTGLQLCQKLLNTPQSDLVYIVMLTTFSKIDHKIRGVDKGADEYVTKPYAVQNLLDRIHAALNTVKEKRQAVIDPLTKLYTKEFFNTHLAQEVSASQRYQRHLAFVLGGIDREIDDAALVVMGKILRINCRRSDLPVRWDGKEFAILLPETDFMGGMLFAERVRQSIAAYQFKGVEQLTASFGVATLKTNRQELIERAEMGLQDAQKSGGNKVVASNK